MYYQELLELASLVGLNRAIIARRLGLTAVQVTRWATGSRPIPRKYRQEIWEMVQTAAEDFLRAGPAQAGPPPAPGEPGSLAWPFQLPARRAHVAARLESLALIHAEQRGQGLSALLAGTVEALEAFRNLPPHELRKPATLARIHELALRLLVLSEELTRLAPQIDDPDTPEEENRGSETAQSDGP